MTFTFGQGITSDILSDIKPESRREAMLLEALETAYRSLERIQWRGESLDMDAYDGLKNVERLVMVWFGARNE